MSKQNIAELVTKMTVDNAQFEKEMRRSQKTTGNLAAAQKKAANDSVFGSKKMSQGFRQAANSAATLSGPMGGVSSRLGTVATGLGAVGVAATAAGLAVSGLAVIIGLSIGKFAELEKRTLRTEALFKATSGAAGLTTNELAELADAVAENTLASVQGTTQAINVLQTFKSVTGDAFERTIALSQDLAATMGGDIKSSVLQLGKALEDPVTGLNALRRSGVSFTLSQKALIQSLVETGQVAEAQNIILDTLEKQVGGAGAAEGAGLSGAADLLGQRWDEMLESLAETTLVGQATTSSLNALAGALESVTGFFAGPQTIEDYKDKLAELRAEIDATTNSGRGAGANAGRLAEIAEIEATIAKLEEKDAREREIIKEGNRLRKEAAQQAANDRLVIEQKSGAQRLASLTSTLASEREKYLIQWEDRNEIIDNLVLSQEQIQARGFETLLDLQRSYQEQSNALYAESTFQYDERKRQEVQIAIDAAEAKAKAEEQAKLREQQAAGNAFVANLDALAQYNSKYAGIAKAAAIAQATISAYTGANKALETLAPPYSYVAAAASLAAGLANVATIKATPIAGARELGDPVSGGKTYLVGEKGPELFTAGASGQITSNANMNKAMRQPSGGMTLSNTVNINGNASASVVDQLKRENKRFARYVQSIVSVPV